MNGAFIGLGRMGWPMAGHLLKTTDSLAVYDIDSETAKRWHDRYGGPVADSIEQAASGADFIVSSLPSDQELQAVAAVLLPVIRSEAVWVDHSTGSAQGACAVAEQIRDAGGYFLDAPVSGGVDGAKAAALTIMVGGQQSAFDRVSEVMQAYATRITYMGASGAGQTSKMANQICVIGLCQALAEGLDFASRAGLDTEKLLTVMLQGSSASWQMQNRAEKMLAGQYDFGFSTQLMRKDVGLLLDRARAMNVSLPVTALVGQFLADVEALGGSDWDWCSLMERQRRFAVPPSGE